MGISLKNSFFKGFQHKYFLLLKVLHALQMYFLFYQNVLSNEIWVCWFFDSSIVQLKTIFSNAFKYSFDKSTTWRLMQLKLMSTSPHTSLAILAKKNSTISLLNNLQSSRNIHRKCISSNSNQTFNFSARIKRPKSLTHMWHKTIYFPLETKQRLFWLEF